MTDYLTRFKALADELAGIDYIEVKEFKAGAPASSKTIAAAEERLGATLAPAIRDFYEQANGLKFHWQIKPNVSPELAVELREKSKDYYVEIAEYIGTPFAIVDILSLEDSVLKDDWEELKLGDLDGTTKLMGNEYDSADLAELLKPFDILNREYCMAFFLEAGNGDPPVLLLGDGWMDWNGSRVTDFASYVEMVLATRGIVEARIKIFGKPGGTEKRRLVGDARFWHGYVPKLFA